MVTVFVNCKIIDSSGSEIGAVGVGIKVNNLQEFLQNYDQRFDLKANLIMSKESGRNQYTISAGAE